MSVAIAIEVGSPSSRLPLVQRTFESITENIGTDDFVFIVAIAPGVPVKINDYIINFNKTSKNIIFLPSENYYWADFINYAIDLSQDYEFFIKAHDDIELITPNFFQRVQSEIQKLSEPLGWINFTDIDYLNGHWAPSTRPGFHSDYLFENGWQKNRLFQFHSLPENWIQPPFRIDPLYGIRNGIQSICCPSQIEIPSKTRKYYELLPYDFPGKPVKCHAPFNHFVMIQRKQLELIGKCENWRTYNALLVDEDWGLRALQLGLFNIWIPQIEYIHTRIGGGTRSWNQITKDQMRVHELFFNKWGFHSEGKKDEMEMIRTKYKNTNIPWSINKRSYEWEYVQ
jgi:hypothetical protein